MNTEALILLINPILDRMIKDCEISHKMTLKFDNALCDSLSINLECSVEMELIPNGSDEPHYQADLFCESVCVDKLEIVDESGKQAVVGKQFTEIVKHIDEYLFDHFSEL